MTEHKNLFNDLDIIQSTQINDYLMDNSKYHNNNQCRVEFGLVGGTNVSQIQGNLVDLENDLYGLTRTASRCPKYHYIPQEGNIQKPINYIKPVINPELNLKKKHLKSCNFFNYQEIPKEPPLVLDKCE
jgi:hypothetical protein